MKTHTIRNMLQTMPFLVFLTFSPNESAAGDYEQEVSVGAGGKLVLDSVRGAIVIGTWNQDTVKIVVRNGKDVYQKDELDLKIEQEGNDVRIKARAERKPRSGLIFNRNRQLEIGYEIMVPERYNLDLKTGGGSIRIADISGNVVAVTSGGTIRLSNVDGDVDVLTEGGSIHVGNIKGRARLNISGGGTIRAGMVQDSVEAIVSAGSINLEGSAQNVIAIAHIGNISVNKSAGNIEATAMGRITIGEVAGYLEANSTGRGDINVALFTGLSDSSPHVIIENAEGNISLGIPEDFAADVSMEARLSDDLSPSLQINSEFPIRIEANGIHSVTGRGEINGGGNRIRMRADIGNISLLKQQ